MDDNYIIDNKAISLKDQIIKYSNVSSEAKIASGYFYINGYRLVSEAFQNLDKVQIVIGNELSVDVKEDELISCKDYLERKMLEDLEKEEDENLKKKVREIYNLLNSKKIDIRIYNKGVFHPKLYIFLGENKTAIVGSSNFTKPGFLTNVELNVIEEKSEKIEKLVTWFDEVWENESEPFQNELIKIIETSGVLNTDSLRWGTYLPPRELFKLFAYEILDGRVSLAKDQQILTLFQEVGVLNAEEKMAKYFGCLVADSVGLGKSFIGAEILKDFLYGRKDFWNGKLEQKWNEKGKGCLLIVPAHLRKQWRDDVLLKVFFTNCSINTIDGEYHFKLIDKESGTLGELKIMSYSKFVRSSERSLNQLSDQFDLILIDEAHRFRDENTNAWNNIQLLKKKSSYIGELGYDKESIRNRFILLTATPLNNRISDLLNLFKIFLDRDLRDLTRYGKNITLFEKYNQLKKELKINSSNKELKEKLRNNVRGLKDEILDDLMILRTRKYILESLRYKGTEINGKPLVFKDPFIKKIEYDKEVGPYYKDYLELYTDLAIFLEKLEYPYIDLFLLEDGKKVTFKVLLKIMLLKRIESSIYAFDISLQRIKEKEEFLIQLLEKKKNAKDIQKEWNKKFKTNKEMDLDEDEELGILAFEELEETQESENGPKLDTEKLLSLAKKDLELINAYEEKLKKVKKDEDTYIDPKIKRLTTVLKDNIYSNGNNTPKVLLFTQFKDTANYVHKELQKYLSLDSTISSRDIGLDIVTGDIEIETKEKKLKRFAPVANNHEIKDETEINFLVSTDALSEGVNLQDASIVINYDLPWNPMRIVQRVGRVNRIGSTSDVYVYNFFPTRDLEELLKLLDKLQDKIEDVKNLLAKEMQILSEEEDVTVETLGEKIKGTRQELDITQLELNARSEDFKVADVYGEDEETIQKLRIVSKLDEIDVSEKEFKKVEDMLSGTPYYTILDSGHILRLYRIFDKFRNEKMRNYFVKCGENCEEAPFDVITSIIDIEKEISKMDLSQDKREAIEERVKLCDKYFEDELYKEYKNLFSPLRQGQITQFQGIHRDLIRYLRGISRQRTLSEDEQSKNKLLRVKQIYESMNLKNNETSELKKWFESEGIDIERDNLLKIDQNKIIDILERFYDNYLSKLPGTYFGGIRTDKDLDYRVIGWQL